MMKRNVETSKAYIFSVAGTKVMIHIQAKDGLRCNKHGRSPKCFKKCLAWCKDSSENGGKNGG